MDTLPTVSECVMSILSYAPTYGVQKQKETIRAFSHQLEELWQKAFSGENIVTRKTIVKKLDKHMQTFRNKVQKNRLAKANKISKRHIIKNWKSENSVLFDLLKHDVDPNLFDTDERNFYHDQLSGRRSMAISDQVDEEHDICLENQKTEDFSDCISSEDDDPHDETCSAALSTIHDNKTELFLSQTRSGKMRLTKSVKVASTQTEKLPPPTTPIRNHRNCLPDVKKAIATTSSKASITTEQARRAFQATCEVFTKDKYYLSVDDIPKEDYESDLTSPSKRKRPKSAEDYEKYKYVLPSARVINREKHLQAIQVERNCALAMLDATSEDVITIHYDTTKRRRIQGEWTSLINQMSSGKAFRLRPLSLSVENRETISDLLVEELKRLAKAGDCSAQSLWQKVTSLMTDSVSKNLKIEESIAATLNSTHVPFHLLCVSHTCVSDKGVQNHEVR